MVQAVLLDWANIRLSREDAELCVRDTLFSIIDDIATTDEERVARAYQSTDSMEALKQMKPVQIIELLPLVNGL